MYQVIKRDGRRVDFDLARIANAITKAFDAAKIPYNTAIIDLLALQVTADYAGKVNNNEIGVEDIQDSVEAVLQRAGYAAVAKSYILYRKNREKMREMRSTVLDYKKLVDDYLRVSDWRVKENSTVTYSVGGLILSNSGAITANYWLSEIYDEEIGDAHRSADLHLHDLSMLTGARAQPHLPQRAHHGVRRRRDGKYDDPDEPGHLSGAQRQKIGGGAGLQRKGCAHEPRDRGLRRERAGGDRGRADALYAGAQPPVRDGRGHRRRHQLLRAERLFTRDLQAR